MTRGAFLSSAASPAIGCVASARLALANTPPRVSTRCARHSRAPPPSPASSTQANSNHSPLLIAHDNVVPVPSAAACETIVSMAVPSGPSRRPLAAMMCSSCSEAKEGGGGGERKKRRGTTSSRPCESTWWRVRRARGRRRARPAPIGDPQAPPQASPQAPLPSPPPPYYYLSNNAACSGEARQPSTFAECSAGMNALYSERLLYQSEARANQPLETCNSDSPWWRGTPSCWIRTNENHVACGANVFRDWTFLA